MHGFVHILKKPYETILSICSETLSLFEPFSCKIVVMMEIALYPALKMFGSQTFLAILLTNAFISILSNCRELLNKSDSSHNWESFWPLLQETVSM